MEAFRNLKFGAILETSLFTILNGSFMFLDLKKMRSDASGKYFFVGSRNGDHDVSRCCRGRRLRVPSELSEDEVMAAIGFEPGWSDDLEEVAAHSRRLSCHTSHSPRYLVKLEALPKTENEKVREDVRRGR